jgi:hypothetical protein
MKVTVSTDRNIKNEGKQAGKKERMENIKIVLLPNNLFST